MGVFLIIVAARSYSRFKSKTILKSLTCRCLAVGLRSRAGGQKRTCPLEVFGRSGLNQFTGFYSDVNPFEASIAARYTINGMWSVTGGGGRGFGNGIGAPDLRFFAMAAFNPDFGRGPETPQPDQDQDGEMFGLSVFIRDGDAVYRSYFTSNRGVEALGPVWTLLDLTPFGRQETWQDAPAGTPQGAPYEWWRRHGKYESRSGASREA